MEPREYVKTGFPVDTVHDVLKSPVRALTGVTDSMAAEIEPLHVRTVFDLAVSPIFGAAAAAAGLGPLGRQLLEVGEIPAALFDLDAVDGDVDDLAEQPLDVLRAVSAAKATALSQVLGAATLGDLAQWPPYVASVDLLSQAVTVDEGFEYDGIPADLVPGSGTYPTERVFYERFLMDRELTSGSRTPAKRPPAPSKPKFVDSRQAPGAVEPVPGRTELADAGPLELRDTADLPPARPALGAIARFSQSWYREGLTLGQLLHSVALAPGEMTRVAMVDWSRRAYGNQSETVSQTESLTHSVDHNRAIGEVTRAVADENQSGSTTNEVGSVSAQLGLAGAGINPTGSVWAGSFGASGNYSKGTTWTTSNGRREINASLAQRIRDTTHQAANATRNRRASVVQEVSQEESERLSTRVVVNYNHMHAMTVQYYEVVQLYRVALRLEEVDRCLFIPVAPIDFSDPAAIYRHRHALAAAALDHEVRGQLLANPNSVAVTAPALPDGGTPWDVAVLADIGRRMRHPVGPRPERTIHLPASATLITRELEGQAWIQSGAYGADLVTGERYRTYNWPSDQDGPRSVPIGALRELTLHTIGGLPKEGEDPDATVEVTLHLPIEVDGDVWRLPFTTVIRRHGLTTLRLQFRGGSAAGHLVTDHLEQHRLHYSAAVWRAVDPMQLTAMLAGYQLDGEPLTELVDPQPLTMAGTYLVFRLRTDPREDASWRDWLAEHDLQPGYAAEDIVPLPSGGVHAEAVLGRANSAEKLDITRFWNWEDSPIPIKAPEIEAVAAGSRHETVDLTTGDLGNAIVKVVEAGKLPDPQGMAALMTAVTNGNAFRDMSHAATATQLLTEALKAASNGAKDASEQAGDNMKTYVELLKSVTEAAAKIATGGAASALAAANPSTVGALGNQADKNGKEPPKKTETPTK